MDWVSVVSGLGSGNIRRIKRPSISTEARDEEGAYIWRSTVLTLVKGSLRTAAHESDSRLGTRRVLVFPRRFYVHDPWWSRRSITIGSVPADSFVRMSVCVLLLRFWGPPLDECCFLAISRESVGVVRKRYESGGPKCGLRIAGKHNRER